MKSRFLLAAIAVLAAGCGTVRTRTVDQTNTPMRGQIVAVTERDKPEFTTFNLAKVSLGAVTGAVSGLGVLGAGVLGGVVGGVQALAGVDERNNHTARLPDPAHAVAAELNAALVKRDNIKKAHGSVRAPNGSRPADIAAAARGNADYVLDIQTVMWGIYYQPTAWTSYDLKFQAIGSLINVKTGAVVASATCKDLPDVNPRGPSYNQMMANDSALIKQMVAYEVAGCVATLKRDMLAL